MTEKAVPLQLAAVKSLMKALGLTVTVAVLKQPVPKVYDITDSPADWPVTTPDPGTTVATAGVSLLQVPPAVASLKVVVEPWHTVKVPVITAGKGLTITARIPSPLLQQKEVLSRDLM